MLILKRKREQSIIIGNDVEIVITEIKGDSVKIGIKAPKSLAVHRKEIYDLIQKQNIQATKHSFEDIDRLVDIMKQK